MTEGGSMIIPAPFGKRISAAVIDYAALTLISVVLSIIFGTDWRYATFFTFAKTTGGMPDSMAVLPTILMVVMYLGYFIIFESVAQTSIGKTLLGLTVIKENGQKAGLREAIVRTLFRGVDGAPLWYFTGLIAIFLSPTRQRIGDHIAQAIVVETATVDMPVAGN
jgi:uncharacterized RDD family membrane protein YckC